jgi:hypothetical protein
MESTEEEKEGYVVEVWEVWRAREEGRREGGGGGESTMTTASTTVPSFSEMSMMMLSTF